MVLDYMRNLEKEDLRLEQLEMYGGDYLPLGGFQPNQLL